jgi:hypothetical protein
VHVDHLAQAAIVACRPGSAEDRALELAGPVSLPARALVERAGRLPGRRIRIDLRAHAARPSRLLVFRRVAARGVAPDLLEVLTTETRVDPAPAGRERGIARTRLEDMIHHGVAS